MMSPTDASDLIPARMVNEFVYCPRLFYLEWVQGDFAHSADTLEGAAVHRRVDREQGPLPDAGELEAEDRVAARGVLLSAPKLGLIARIDLLEGGEGRVRPVDYKKGAPGREGPWEPDRVQLCVQGLILRENGYRCDEGVVYYATSRQRFTVPFDPGLIRRTLDTVQEIRHAIASPLPPPPLVDSPKCPRCSLVGLCLPDEVNALRERHTHPPRRLIASDPPATPLYGTTPGSRLTKRNGRVVLIEDGREVASRRLLDVSHVAVFGNVDVGSALLRA